MRNGSPAHRHRMLIVGVALALLSSGCTSGTPDTTAVSSPSIAAPTASGAGSPASSMASAPLTAQDLAWLHGVTRMHQRLDKELLTDQSVTLTRSKLRSWETQMRSCRTELARLGDAGARLQPVATLAGQACARYDKGAACVAAIRRDLYNSTASKRIEQNVDCAIDAAGDGSNLLNDAEAKGRDIDEATG